jgi:hypothetical protein
MIDTHSDLMQQVYKTYKTILSVKDNSSAKANLKETENLLYFLDNMTSTIAHKLGTYQPSSKSDLTASINFWKEQARKDIDAASKQLSFID